MTEWIDIPFSADRDGQTIVGRAYKIQEGLVFVSLLPPFQYFTGSDPVDGGDPGDQARAIFEQLADTWAWILRTPDFRVDRAALVEELASLPWLISDKDVSHRLGSCYGDEGQLLVPEPLADEISRVWGDVWDFTDRYVKERVLDLASRRGCPHPRRVWEVWNEMDIAPDPLPPDSDD
jgi:hypothetical protein